MRRGAAAVLLAVALAATGAAAPARAAESKRPPKVLALAKRLFEASGASRTTRGGPIVRRRDSRLDGIVVTEHVTLPEVARRLPRLVREVNPGVWEVRRDIFVINDARLFVSVPEVRELRLLSTPRRFVSIIARNGHLRFRGEPGRRLLVRSWDPTRGGVDPEFLDGRSSIAARRRSRLTAHDVRFEHLGFFEGTVSGVATRSVPGKESTGDVRRSVFAHNYFGAYTFESRDMRWIDNQFVDNHLYGFDPHDDSDGFLVEGNYAARNGRHGIIFSRLCDDNVLRGNVVEDNGWHGIVIDDGRLADGPSNRNRIVGNVVRRNHRVGISIDGSSQNLVRENLVLGGRYGVRVIRNSRGNAIVGNRLLRASEYGVFLDGQPRRGTIVSDTVVSGNVISGAETGVRLRDSVRTVVLGNRIGRVRLHGLKVDGTHDRDTVLESNVIEGRGPSPVFVLDRVAASVRTGGNAERWNYPLAHDLARVLGWYVGPALWGSLLLAAVVGPLVVRARRRVRRSLRPT